MDTPVLCTAVLVLRPGPAGRPEVLLLKRAVCLAAGRHYDPDAGNYHLPGGRLEDGESPEECARRSLREQTGLIAHRLEPLAFTDEPRACGRRIGLVYRAVQWEGEMENRETHRNSEVAWHGLDGLPRPLMGGTDEVLRRLAAEGNGVASASGPLAGLAGLASAAPVLPTFVDPVGDF